MVGYRQKAFADRTASGEPAAAWTKDHKGRKKPYGRSWARWSRTCILSSSSFSLFYAEAMRRPLFRHHVDAAQYQSASPETLKRDQARAAKSQQLGQGRTAVEAAQRSDRLVG